MLKYHCHFVFGGNDMSGHSKWATTKRRKAAVDAKRGKIFSKLSKEITVAARIGGKDINSNLRLRRAVESAKSYNMPSDNIERAILRGVGELEDVTYEEASYEGYGPGGAALLMEVLTDNKNRATADIRHILTRNGGNLGERGCVSWMFDKKGLIVVDSESVDEDEVFAVALDAGAEDFQTADDRYEIYTTPETFEQVRDVVAEAGIETSLEEISMIPQTTVKVEGKQAEQLLRLLESLDENDDVQNVYSNFDIPDEMLESAA